MNDMAHDPQHEKEVTRDPLWVAVGWSAVALVVLVLLAYGVAGSYESLAHLAAINGVPLPRFAPVGLDGGLIGTITLDIILTAMGHPIGWLRQVARLLAVSTVAANAWAGWPHPVAVFYRVFAPLLIVVISEAIRTVLLRQARDARDPVPFSRWLLSPWPTWKLYRRMVLWGITSYAAAVDMELSRLHAMARLEERFGKDWRGHVPVNLTWMLDRGVRMEDALALVARVTVPAKPEVQPRTTTPNKTRRSAPKRRSGSAPVKASGSAPVGKLNTEAAALDILDAEPEISGQALGRRLGVSESYGCRLKAKLTHAEHETGPLPRVMGD